MNGPQVAKDQQQQPSEEEVMHAYRESLDDAIALLEGIGPICSDLDELIGMLQLAQKNDSQLMLIMKHVAPKRMRGK